MELTSPSATVGCGEFDVWTIFKWVIGRLDPKTDEVITEHIYDCRQCQEFLVSTYLPWNFREGLKSKEKGKYRFPRGRPAKRISLKVHDFRVECTHCGCQPTISSREFCPKCLGKMYQETVGGASGGTEYKCTKCGFKQYG